MAASRTALVFVVSLCMCTHDSAAPLDPTGDGVVIVGVYADAGAAQACVEAARRMFEWMGYQVTRIDAATVNDGVIDHIDVFYFPGGSSGPYRRDIRDSGRDRIRDRIRAGCAYIGTCAGGLFGASRNLWDGASSSDGLMGVFQGLAAGPIPDIFEYPEIGMCKVTLSRSHPISASLPDTAWILFYNGPYFIPDTGDAAVVATYDITGHAAIVASSYGHGRVVLTGPHPEWEEDSDRDGVSYFDHFDDRGSEWDLMQRATRWCLHELE
ncbi:hypothetical protein JXA88_05170 [Candidatus Fermentibacteria bacterium]|nr:hypothetical protein [Candidatus Fermentibacteria bacterium]